MRVWLWTSFSVLQCFTSVSSRVSLSLCVRSGHAHLDSMGFKSLHMSFRKTERKALLALTCARELLLSVSRHSFLHVRPVDSCMCGSFITNSEGLSDAVKHHTHISSGNELLFWSLLRLARSLGICMHAQFMLHERAKCTPTVIPRSRASAESRVNALIDIHVTFIRQIGTRVIEARGR